MGSKNNIRISHSAIMDFNSCARLYYFKHIYKNPKTGNRIQIVNPYLSLGSAVHDTIDKLNKLSPRRRKSVSLSSEFQRVWKHYSGRKGGFTSLDKEKEFKKRGVKMIRRVEKADFLRRKSLNQGPELPRIELFEGVDLVGSFDWIEVLPDGLHIIDFKTGKKEENSDSLQLPIYRILADKNFSLKVKKTSYWYLDRELTPTIKKMESAKETLFAIKVKAIEIKTAIEHKKFSCSSRYNRCFWCGKYESALSGKAEYIGIDGKMGKDLFYLPSGPDVLLKVSQNGFLNDSEKDILRARLGVRNEVGIKVEKKMSGKKIKETVETIKKKIKDNLSHQELKLFIKELEKNGERLSE